MIDNFLPGRRRLGRTVSRTRYSPSDEDSAWAVRRFSGDRRSAKAGTSSAPVNFHP
jgi:hypothetical protein